jgi:hypothetical protein
MLRIPSPYRLRRVAPVVGSLAILAVASRPLSAQFEAAAQPEKHLIRFGVEGGVVVPTAHAADALKTGVHGQGFVLIDLMGFPLRLSLGYQRFNLKEALTNAVNQEGSSSQIGGIAGTQIDLLHTPLRPYIVAGVGGFNIMDQLKAANGTTSSSSQFKFGVDGGAGLSLKLGRLSAFVEGRVQNVYTESGMIDAKSIRSIPVSFGLLF